MQTGFPPLTAQPTGTARAAHTAPAQPTAASETNKHNFSTPHSQPTSVTLQSVSNHIQGTQVELLTHMPIESQPDAPFKAESKCPETAQITGAGVQGLCLVDNFYFKAL